MQGSPITASLACLILTIQSASLGVNFGVFGEEIATLPDLLYHILLYDILPALYYLALKRFFVIHCPHFSDFTYSLYSQENNSLFLLSFSVVGVVLSGRISSLIVFKLSDLFDAPLVLLHWLPQHLLATYSINYSDNKIIWWRGSGYRTELVNSVT